MSWFKYSTLIVILFSSQVSAKRFSSDECLKSSYEANIEHNGKFFGLVKNKLTIKKEECLVSVTFKNILETKWVVDLCREPIHMKIHAKGSESVYKRKGQCDIADESDFCVYWRELHETLQDYGLIFAKGERESLNTDHGKTYCSYLLLGKHLDEGILFSKYRQSVELFDEGNTSAENLRPLPAKIKAKEQKKEIKSTLTPSQSKSTESADQRKF